MPDVGPPVVDGDERETLVATLNYLRSRVIDKLTGVDEQRYRESTLVSGTTMYWLGTHMAAGEINQFLSSKGSSPGDPTPTWFHHRHP